jgi:hypothetical protein
VEGLVDPLPQPRAAERPVRVAAARRSATPIVIIVVMLFGLSGGSLWYLGYNYNGLSGNPVTKIHPATYLIVATFLWNAVKAGNPVAYAVQSAWHRPGSFFLLVAMLILFTDTVSRDTPGMAGSIDTYLGPSLLVVLMVGLDERGMRRIETALHIVMAANAVTALVELAIGVRFFPFRFDGAIDIYDSRSTALQGHPLENATTTAFYILALLSSNTSLPKAGRVILVVLQFLALVAFGGRTGMCVALLLGSLYLATVVHRTLRSGRVSLLTAAATMILLALLPVVIGALASSGFFDAMFKRFVVDDGGSANSRVEMFRIFDDVDFRDLLFGPDPALIESQRWLHGLVLGIENPIITMLLYQGVLMTIIMTAAVTGFLAEVARRCQRGVWLPMLAFVILLNAAESISSKTNMLAKFALVMLCLYRPRPKAISVRTAMRRGARPMPPELPSMRPDPTDEQPAFYRLPGAHSA